VKVTIPEGYSVAQIFELLVKKGVCTSTAELFNAMETYDYTVNYPLIKELPENPNRCFKLEGYLYPDTYEFKLLSKPEDAIGKFLRNSKVKITEADRQRAAELGYSINEILTIASMIEKEAGNKAMMPDISAVIHNS
jgi:cell division protein YceG involved in septum cleavage